MPCAGCNPGIAQHTGTFIKYWCASDGTYHFDWEPCGPSSPPSSPSPIPNGGSSPPIVNSGVAPASPSAPLNFSAMSGKGNCGCCGGAPTAPAATLTQIQTASTATTAKPCCGGCAGRSESKWLAILSAVVLALLAVAALSDG